EYPGIYAYIKLYINMHTSQFCRQAERKKFKKLAVVKELKVLLQTSTHYQVLYQKKEENENY
ncbi:MAG: hypothetical protein Q8867_09775, partial [Bacteroidota bacterium]|nr:hypothetical protein [Bacteroidota bacterium]